MVHPDMSCVIQVTNIAPTVTAENLRTFFTHVGTIRELAMYPKDTSRKDARACYIKFLTPTSAAVAQHLSNTVFNEWALQIKPHPTGEVPDEITALKLALQASAKAAGTGVVNQVSTHNGNQVLLTVDPRFVELGLPPYPPLLASLEPTKVEEIRKTIHVTNIAESTSPEDLVSFFNQFGEVKYVRMTCPENDVIKTALVEFTDQATMVRALQNNGINLNGNSMGIAHSTIAILKPKLSEKRSYETVSSRSRSRRSRSNSRRRNSRSPIRSTRRRSRSPRSRRSRSPYKSRRRSRSRSSSRDRIRSRRERSRERRTSRDREREREKERERERERERDRERDRDKRRSIERRERTRRERSRERSKDRERRRRDRERDRDSPARRERSKSRDRRNRREESRRRESRRSRSKSHSVSRSSNVNPGTSSHPSSGQILTFTSLLKDEQQRLATVQEDSDRLTSRDDIDIDHECRNDRDVVMVSDNEASRSASAFSGNQSPDD